MKLLFSVTKADFDTQTFTVGGHGGGGKDTSNSGVRLIHRASGAVGEGREHRSNTMNRKAAFERLLATKEWKSWHKAECDRLMGANTVAETIRLDAGFGKNQIRTYHFVQNRVTDHRLKKNYDLKSIMDGKLEPVILDYLRAGTQRESGGSAKPLFVSSILTRPSKV